MKTRRKHKSCLNCGEILERKYNFCPNCGQENTDNHVSIGLLVREFTSNFFSLDSRFGRTFKPFLFAPGKITEAFIEGKRVKFANPIRWYLVISLFHFFFMSRVFQPSAEDRRNHGFIVTEEEMSASEYDSLLIYRDSTSSDEWPLSGEQFALLTYLSENSELTTEEVMDSLHFNQKPFFTRLAVKQLTKINQESNASLNSYLLRQIPLIIFFLLPVYAFLLKIFFWKKGLYIKHLIHSIHLHSFFFFLMGCTWIVTMIWKGFEDYGASISLFLSAVYIVLSFRRIYDATYFKAVLKLLAIGIIYLFVLGFILLLGIFLSLLLF